MISRTFTITGRKDKEFVGISFDVERACDGDFSAFIFTLEAKVWIYLLQVNPNYATIIKLFEKLKYPGVAKLGIALEWGSRGPEFESRHSDQ